MDLPEKVQASDVLESDVPWALSVVCWLLSLLRSPSQREAFAQWNLFLRQLMQSEAASGFQVCLSS